MDKRADQPDRLPPVALPTPHFLGLAPLDVWLRLLMRPGKRAHLRYLPRAVLGVLMSVFGTLITLPERLLLWPFLRTRFGGERPTFEHEPGVVVILGYFRSGTTHLHYTLSCDPRFATPSWAQVTAPQGFWASWWFLRFVLVPFLPNARPQDDVAFGPEWPAEDDFAVCNWALGSSLPGRFVFPSRREEYDRWHYLHGLSARELSRWRRYQAAVCWKATRGARAKRLLLKSPSHTARVAELDALFGGKVKFVHITREPEAVIRSNAAMHERLRGYLLEDPPTRGETRAHIAREYERTEQKFLDESAVIPDDRLVRIKYDDLIADPLAALEQIYTRLGLGWSDELDARFTRYLRAVADYRAADRKGGPRPTIAAAGEEEHEICARLRERFGHGERNGEGGRHGRDARATRIGREDIGTRAQPNPLPKVDTGPEQNRTRKRGYLVAVLAAVACLGLWFLIAWLTHNRLDTLVWVWGTLIGWAAIRASGRGDWRLGAWAAAWFLLMVGASVWPMPTIAGGWTGTDRLVNIRSNYGNLNSAWLYMAFGAVAAYRFASRKHIRPPGK